MNPIDTMVSQRPTRKQDLCQTCGLDRNVVREALTEPVFWEHGYNGNALCVLNENRQTCVFAASGCDECKKVLGLED